MKRKKSFVVIEPDLITGEMKCPNYGKTTLGGNTCYFHCFKPSALKEHVISCSTQLGEYLNVEIKTKNVFSNYSLATKRQKFVPIFKMLKTKSDATEFLNMLKSRTDGEFGFDSFNTFLDIPIEAENEKLLKQVENLKKTNADLISRNSEFEKQLSNSNDSTVPPFHSISDHIKYSVRGLSAASNMSTFAETVLYPTEQSKLYYSMLFMCSSKSNLMSNFSKTKLTYGKNFLFESLNFPSVQRLLARLEQHMQGKKIKFCHFDNNDVKVPFAIGMQETYITTTSYVMFDPHLPSSLRLDNLKEFKPLPSLREIKNISREILQFSQEEIQIWKEEQYALFQLFSKKNYGNVWKFQNKRRERKKIDIDQEKIVKDEEYFQDKFIEFIDIKRVVQIKSSAVACKSGEDFDHHIEHVNSRFPECTIVYVGDQPVYERQRQSEFAFPGKFHLKLNMLLGIFHISYDLGPSQILQNAKYFNKKKSLKTIPSGYFKMSERLFCNSFLSYWDMYSSIIENHISSNSSPSSSNSSSGSSSSSSSSLQCDFSGFNSIVCSHIENNRVKFRGSYSFVKQLSFFCNYILLSYYLLVKSIKTSNFELYILSIKLFLSWALGSNKGNYFRILVLHLFDISYTWTDDMLALFKANLSFVTTSKNHVPFDEMGEIANKDTKTTTRNARNPAKKVEMISVLNPLIGFLKHVFEPNYDYTKEKVLKNLIVDLENGWNPLIEHFEKMKMNELKIYEGFQYTKNKNRESEAYHILHDEWQKQKN